MIVLCILASLLGAVATAAPAEAQSETTGTADEPVRYLVVPVGAMDNGTASADVSEFAERVRASLRQRGLMVIDPQVAAAIVEARISTPARRLTAVQLTEIGSIVDQATLALSSGRLQRAETLLQRLGDMRDDALEDVNRDVSIARSALDGCLLGVRARLSAHDPGGALQLAERCHLAHPNIDWSPNYHPQPTLDVFTEAGVQLATRGGATLRIEIPDGISPDSPAREGAIPCVARLNGVPMGTSFPVLIRSFRPGDTSVQVECTERPGRIHRITLQPGDNHIFVDPLFDEVVSTGESLALNYGWSGHAPAYEQHMEILHRHVPGARIITVSSGLGAFPSTQIRVWAQGELRGFSHARLRNAEGAPLEAALEGRYTDFLHTPPRDLAHRMAPRAERTATQPATSLGTSESGEQPNTQRPGSTAPGSTHGSRTLRWVGIGALWALASAGSWLIPIWRNDGLQVGPDSTDDGMITSRYEFQTGHGLLLGASALSMVAASTLTIRFGRRDGLHYGQYLGAGLLLSTAGAFFLGQRIQPQRRFREEQDLCAAAGSCEFIGARTPTSNVYLGAGIVAVAGALALTTWGIILDRRDADGDEVDGDDEQTADNSNLSLQIGFGQLRLEGHF